jgi:cellulose synthase operon protein C
VHWRGVSSEARQRRRVERLSTTRVVLLVAAAMVAGMAGIAALFAPPRWLSAVLIGLPTLVTVASLVVEERIRRQKRLGEEAQQDAGWANTCKDLLRFWPLPNVEQADPYDLGVKRSAIADRYRQEEERAPYAPRAVDDRLIAALREKPFVLLKGRSRAGKSRTAFEAMANAFPNHLLVVPVDRTSVRQLAAVDPPPYQGRPAVIWLDDLEQYLGAGGLDAKLLRAWERDPASVRVLATIRLSEHDRLYSTQGELGKTVREVLDRAEAIMLPTDLTEQERATAERLYPGERLVGGLGEHLAAAPELVRKFEDAEESNPAGHAILRAAVDWRRAGVDRPVPETDLRALQRLYLKHLHPLQQPSEDDFRRGLAWGLQLEHRTAALLIEHHDARSRCFEASDVIVDHVERNQVAIPAATWNILLDRVGPADRNQIGFSAYTRGHPDVAKEAWSQTLKSAHPEHAPLAGVNLGELLAGQGDVAGARAAYQQAIDSDHPDLMPLAAFNLGELLAKQGDLLGARGAFHRAIASDHPYAALQAMAAIQLLARIQGGHSRKS